MQSNQQISTFPTRQLYLYASVIACMLTVGCGDPNRNKIVGTWGIEQADSLLRRIESPTEPEPDANLPPKMLITFSRNGRLETVTKMGSVDQAKQGTWKFVSFEESTQTVNVTCVLQNQETDHQIQWLDSETIKLIPPNLAGTKLKLKFKRQP